MKTASFSFAFRVLVVSSLLLAGTLLVPVGADEPRATSQDPGYRPASNESAAFLESVGNTSFDVLPTMIRRLERTAHSFDSQQQIVDFLNDNQIGTAVAKPLRIDQGILEHRTQWDLFKRGTDAVAAVLSTQQTESGYTLAMEILVPGDQSVFGIHVYILDRQGRSAFSFLLNAHHQLFAEAGLVASGSSEAARSKMIADATTAGLRALEAQIAMALDCARRGAAVGRPASEGVLHKFDDKLQSGIDKAGVDIGYSTFAGPDSRVSYRTTQSAPPREGSAPRNGALRIDLDVDSWGGVINRFASNALDEWIPQDWRELEGFSFWFHGENSGAPIFFDVFDNRGACSTTDDAERFRYRFMDDVAGWRQVRVRFADLTRWNVGNNAPDDGLGLAKVYGWGIGTSNSEGAVDAIIYVDDFRLLSELPDEFSQSTDLVTHGMITELRLDETTSRIQTSIHDDGRLVIHRVVDLVCACLQLAVDRDFSYYRIDQREILNGDRARFRLTFYAARPTDVPVLDIPDYADDEPFAVDISAAIPVDRIRLICPRERQ